MKLKKHRIIDQIPYPRPERKLPVVLSQGEVRRFLASITSLRYRAVLVSTYAAGLRVSEVTALRVSDIDSRRMLIGVRDAKVRKDRYVMLSPALLKVLREYWKAARPKSSRKHNEKDGRCFAGR